MCRSKRPPSVGGTQTLFTVKVPVTTPDPLRVIGDRARRSLPFASVIEPLVGVSGMQLPPTTEV